MKMGEEMPGPSGGGCSLSDLANELGDFHQPVGQRTSPGASVTGPAAPVPRAVRSSWSPEPPRAGEPQGLWACAARVRAGRRIAVQFSIFGKGFLGQARSKPPTAKEPTEAFLERMHGEFHLVKYASAIGGGQEHYTLWCVKHYSVLCFRGVLGGTRLSAGARDVQSALKFAATELFLSHAVEKSGQPDAEHLGDPAEIENGQVSLTAFDRTDERPVQAALVGQFFLRQLLGLPGLAKERNLPRSAQSGPKQMDQFRRGRKDMVDNRTGGQEDVSLVRRAGKARTAARRGPLRSARC